MREQFESEIKGDGQTYVDKLEDKMLNADKEAGKPDEVAKNSQVPVIDGASILNTSKEEKDYIVKLRYDIKGHFDQVRDLFYLDQTHILASVSEDCQVHLWNLKNISIESDNLVSNLDKINLESYCTLRGHRGAIYSITGLNGS